MGPTVRPDFPAIAKASGESRTIAQLTEHYVVEKELAGRLMQADSLSRGRLYRELYEELFARIPHHPQHRTSESAAERIKSQSDLLRQLVPRGAIFVEIGAGDARLSIAMAGHCAHSTAVDVTPTIAEMSGLPANFSFSLTNGTHLDFPDNTVDFVYSNQLVEHLHPDDARAQFKEALRILNDGGKYLCITPNSYSGPHDISKFFEDRAAGFHLKEYSYRMLAAELRDAGFAKISALLVRKGRIYRLPLGAAAAIESGAAIAGRLLGSAVLRSPRLVAALGITMLAVKRSPRAALRPADNRLAAS
jgi:SAM-dependent methyltransferase